MFWASRPGSAAPAPAAAGVPPKPRRRTGNEVDELQHPLLGDQPTLQLLPPRDAVGARVIFRHHFMSIFVQRHPVWQTSESLILFYSHAEAHL